MIRQETYELVQEFNDKHGVTLQQQWLQFLEELGEAAEAYNREDQDAWEAEMADLGFVWLSLIDLSVRDGSLRVHETARENLSKNAEKDGNKVTKE